MQTDESPSKRTEDGKGCHWSGDSGHERTNEMKKEARE